MPRERFVMIHTLYALVPLALLAVAIAFNVHTMKFSLPTPTTASVLSILVPVFIYTALLIAHNNHSWPTKSRLRMSSIVLQHYTLLILSITLFNVSLYWIISPAIQSVTLHDRWFKLFQTKNAPAIRSIQDAMDCCGFKTSRDMAWPFEDKDHGAQACELKFGRTVGCEDGWAKKERAVMVAMAVIGGLGVAFDVVVNLSIAWGSRAALPKERSIIGGSCETYTDEPATDEPEGRRDGTGELDGDRTQIMEASVGGPEGRRE